MGSDVVPSEDSAPREQPSQRGAALLAALLLVAGAYSGALRVGYVADDRVFLVESPIVKQLAAPLVYFLPAQQLGIQTPAFAYYRPLTTWSHAIERHYFGSGPLAPHAVNVALHLAAVALVYALARRGGAGPRTAALAAALFGVFPRSTEAVTWISGRSTLLSLVCVLGALLLHRSEPERLARRLAAAGALAVGFLCKEFAAVGVGAIVVLEVAGRRRSGTSAGRMLRNLAPSLAIALLYALVRPPLARPGFVPSLASRAFYSLQALGYDASMLANPFGAKLLLGVRGVAEPFFLAAGALLLVIGLFGAVRLLRSSAPPLAIAAVAMAAASLAITLPLLPLGDINLAADRFLYPALAGLAIGAAILLRELPPPRAAVAGALAAVAVALFAWATLQRNEVWRSELALANDSLARTSDELKPYAFLAHFWLARVHLCAGRMDEAIAHQEEGVRALSRFRYLQPAAPDDARHQQILFLMKRGRVAPDPSCEYP